MSGCGLLPLTAADIDRIADEARDPKQFRSQGKVWLLPIQALQLCALARRGLAAAEVTSALAAFPEAFE